MNDNVMLEARAESPLMSDRVLAATALVLVLAGFYKSIILFALVGLLLVAAALPFASGLSIVFLMCLLGLVVPMSLMPVKAAGIKIYGADGLLFFFGAYFVHMAWRMATVAEPGQSRPWAETRLMLVSLLLLAYGVVELGNGLGVQGFLFNDALGDFRRLVVYPMALLIPLILVVSDRQLSLLKYAIVWGGALVLLTGLYRMATGQSFSEEYYTRAEYKPRLFAATETVTLQFLLAYAAALLRLRRGPLHTPMALGMAGIASAFLFISGWRFAFCFVVLAPLGAALLVSHIRGERIWGMVKAVVAIGLVLAVTALILLNAFEAQTQEHSERLLERFTSFDYRHDARFYAWQHALSDLREEPFLGTGLGHQLFFFAKTSDGMALGRHMTLHSYPLDVLCRLGLIGFVLTVLLHVWFNVYCLRRLPGLPRHLQATAVGLYVGYGCNMTMHSIEPYRTGGIVALYLTMGFLVRMLRCASSDPPSDSPSDQAGPGCSPAPLAEQS